MRWQGGGLEGGLGGWEHGPCRSHRLLPTLLLPHLGPDGGSPTAHHSPNIALAFFFPAPTPRCDTVIASKNNLASGSDIYRFKPRLCSFLAVTLARDCPSAPRFFPAM